MGREQRSRALREVVSTALLAMVLSGPSLDAEEHSQTSDSTPFTIVAIPDSQHLVQKYPHIFTAQTEWVRDNVEELNIVFVTHEGDVVQNADSQEEWERARESMRLLDGVVPYGIAPGNHDQDIHRGSTLYEDYFAAAEYNKEQWYGGSYPPSTNWNSFQLFSASGRDFLALHLEFCPTADTIEWANTILKAHPDHRVFLTTHAFLRHDGTFSARHCPEVGVTGSTEAIWDDLVVPNDNVHMVLCGHDYPDNLETPGEVRQTHVVNKGTAAEREVHVLLANYQNIDKKHSENRGFLRIMRFDPSADTVEVTTYSPFRDTYRRGGESQFELTFSLQSSGGGFDSPETEVPEAEVPVTETPVTEVPATPFVRGDCDGDGALALNDAIFHLYFNFLGGDAPGCKAACDSDADGFTKGVSDAVYLLNHQYLRGDSPAAPFPECGTETIAESTLDCANPPAGCTSV
jgi:hypothetical protein